LQDKRGSGAIEKKKVFFGPKGKRGHVAPQKREKERLRDHSISVIREAEKGGTEGGGTKPDTEGKTTAVSAIPQGKKNGRKPPASRGREKSDNEKEGLRPNDQEKCLFAEKFKKRTLDHIQ